MSFLSMIKAIKLTIYYSLHAHKVKPNSQCVEYEMKEKILKINFIIVQPNEKRERKKMNKLIYSNQKRKAMNEKYRKQINQN